MNQCFAVFLVVLTRVDAVDVFDAPATPFGTTLEAFAGGMDMVARNPERFISNGSLTVCLRNEPNGIQAHYVFALDRLVAVAMVPTSRRPVDLLRHGLTRFGAPATIRMGMSPSHGALIWEQGDRWVVLQVSLVQPVDEESGGVVSHADRESSDWMSYVGIGLGGEDVPNLSVLREIVSMIEAGTSANESLPRFISPPPPTPLDKRPLDDYERQARDREERIRNTGIVAVSLLGIAAVLLVAMFRFRRRPR